jgi:hypothetical protein
VAFAFTYSLLNHAGRFAISQLSDLMADHEDIFTPALVLRGHPRKPTSKRKDISKLYLKKPTTRDVSRMAQSPVTRLPRNAG